MKNKMVLTPVLFVIILIQSCERKANYLSNIKTVTDIDGNIYSTVRIGDQVWMAENLRTTHYSNGDSIFSSDYPALPFQMVPSPEFHWAYNCNESYLDVYGRLYTYYVIEDSCEVCPEGWHVPGIEDWQILIDFLGGKDLAGGKLKDTITSLWLKPNAGATNSSGFNGLPGGYRDWRGEFYHKRFGGYWWTSTGNSSSTAYAKKVYYGYQKIETIKVDKRNAYYVRCVQD